jgi:hypothetical protein
MRLRFEVVDSGSIPDDFPSRARSLLSGKSQAPPWLIHLNSAALWGRRTSCTPGVISRCCRRRTSAASSLTWHTTPMTIDMAVGCCLPGLQSRPVCRGASKQACRQGHPGPPGIVGGVEYLTFAPVTS